MFMQRIAPINVSYRLQFEGQEEKIVFISPVFGGKPSGRGVGLGLGLQFGLGLGLGICVAPCLVGSHDVRGRLLRHMQGY